MWYVVSESVQGASHRRTGIPNQDAVNYWPPNGCGDVAIAAVADGLGSTKAFRSGIGAQLAVRVAIQHLTQQVEALEPNASLTMIHRLAKEQWPRNILHNWRDAVQEHWDTTPLDDSEALIFGAADAAALLPFDLSIYGTTLLVCVATPRFLVYLQLGDGDIVVLSENGVPSRPLSKDKRLLGNETTSLASDKALLDWRIQFIGLDSDKLVPPSLIMLATDGYGNSFQEDTGFLQVVTDLATIIRSQGRNYVSLELFGWLNEASACGSGDDVTVCVVGTCQTAES
jgi:serine/threonine protein phosphatase PrpC